MQDRQQQRVKSPTTILKHDAKGQGQKEECTILYSFASNLVSVSKVLQKFTTELSVIFHGCLPFHASPGMFQGLNRIFPFPCAYVRVAQVCRGATLQGRISEFSRDGDRALAHGNGFCVLARRRTAGKPDIGINLAHFFWNPAAGELLGNA